MTRNHQTLELIIRCTECGSILTLAAGTGNFSIYELLHTTSYDDWQICFNDTLEEICDKIPYLTCPECSEDSLNDEDPA